jgi:hypothetical protein
VRFPVSGAVYRTTHRGTHHSTELPALPLAALP